MGECELRRGRAAVVAVFVKNVHDAHAVARDGDKRDPVVFEVERGEHIDVRLVSVAEAAAFRGLIAVDAHQQDADHILVVPVAFAVILHNSGLVVGQRHILAVSAQRASAHQREHADRAAQQQRQPDQHAHDDNERFCTLAFLFHKQPPARFAPIIPAAAHSRKPFCAFCAHWVT